jgi:hypothetical protein
VEVALRHATGGGLSLLRLIVDTGFTGRSALVLAAGDSGVLSRRAGLGGEVRGALTGQQQRGWVSCSVVGAQRTRMLLAIFADLGPLSLPHGTNGMAGLTFLQEFAAWGAEADASGRWQFFLDDLA